MRLCVKHAAMDILGIFCTVDWIEIRLVKCSVCEYE